MSSLPEMPNVVMLNILEKVGFRSLMILRKVSRGFRNYLDNYHTEINLKRVNISLEVGKINFEFEFLGEVIQIDYLKEDYLERFFTDFQVIFKHQKTVLRELFLHINRKVDPKIVRQNLETIQKALPKLDLKVEQLDIQTFQQDHFVPILTLFNPKFLKKIQLHNTKYITNSLDLETISRLEQWKKAEEIYIRNWRFELNMQDFVHFSSINIKIAMIAAEDMLLLKEAAMENPNFSSFRLQYRMFSNIEDIDKLLGPSTEPPGSIKKKWCFDCSNIGRPLEILLNPSFSVISYSRKK